MGHNVGRFLVAFGFLSIFAISCNRFNQPEPPMYASDNNQYSTPGAREAVGPDRRERSVQDSIIQSQQDSIRSLLERLSGPTMETDESRYGRYALQISAWRSKTKAQEIVDTWISRGFTNAYVQEVSDLEAGITWYRVRIGNYNTLESAERVKRRLYLDYDVESWVSQIRPNR